MAMSAAIILATDSLADATAVATALSKTTTKAPVHLSVAAGRYPVGMGAVSVGIGGGTADARVSTDVIDEVLGDLHAFAERDARIVGWAQFTDPASLHADHGTVLVDRVPDAVSDPAFGVLFADRHEPIAITQLREDVVGTSA